ncbi:MAG: protein kinase, partial [Acidobacteria bacterium]|nr:protein kinase [Acidobacteriota bacterium]
MTCPKCSRQNPDAVDRCSGCGSPLRPGTEAPEGPVADLPTRIDAAPPTTSPASRLASGTPLGSRYEIQSVLGEGGMGTVYKAHDRELGRTVALKVIRAEMVARPEVLARFKREILLASQVTHKNVLRIHDLGEAGDVRFISMSYVEGENLKALLEREGPLPLDRAHPLVRQIAEALAAAHEAGVVHRDLKPQNILIDADGDAYIADFGISRSL